MPGAAAAPALPLGPPVTPPFIPRPVRLCRPALNVDMSALESAVLLFNRRFLPPKPYVLSYTDNQTLNLTFLNYKNYVIGLRPRGIHRTALGLLKQNEFLTTNYVLK